MARILRARTFGYQSNCYMILTDRAVAVVDPSVPPEAFHFPDGAVPTHIFLTHAHFDHILALDEYVKRFSCSVYLSPLDAELLDDPEKNASAVFGLPPVRSTVKTLPVSDGDRIDLGEPLEVLRSPGHTAGSVCYRLGDTLFTGDTLFRGGFGRCDLYGGSEAVLRRTLARLFSLPEDYRILPGHGSETHLSDEKAHFFSAYD